MTNTTISLHRPARLLGLSGMLLLGWIAYFALAQAVFPSQVDASDAQVALGVVLTVINLAWLLLVVATFFSGLIWLGVNLVRRYI